MFKLQLPWFLKLFSLLQMLQIHWAMKRIEQMDAENLAMAVRVRQLCEVLAGRASVETRVRTSQCIDYYYGAIERNNNSISLLRKRFRYE